MTVPDAGLVGVCLVLGMLGGMAYLAGLRANVRAYLGGGPVGLAIALHLLRLAIVAASFAAVAQAGRLGLLPALFGFIMGRSAMILWMKGAP